MGGAGAGAGADRVVVKQDVVEVRRDVEGRSEQEETGEREEGREAGVKCEQALRKRK